MTIIAVDQWLSAVFGYGVFRVQPQAERYDQTDLSLLQDHMSQQQRALYFTKIACHAVQDVLLLNTLGFQVIDTNLVFELPSVTAPDPGAPTTMPRIAPAVESDQAGVLDVAERSFLYSRWHLDPLIPSVLAHQSRREWVHNYLLGQRGNALYVAHVDHQVAGFLAAIQVGHGAEAVMVTDLIAVAPEFQRRGIGRALMRHFIRTYQATHARLRVGTQAANIPSVQLYEQLGFRLASSQYALHAHIGANA